ncbi:MAG: hypothetical protein HYV29_00125 [Ignavibacteriales bacterium]|nr:hypothetical protein [Ignavibacteriales bacterium]
MGDDLDAALSAHLYLAKNPASKIVGIYTEYKTLFYNSSLSTTDLERSVYIDLDINHPSCRSLGHHIVRNNGSDALIGLRNSCNPNEIVGRSVTHGFKEKYPLGTIHFLMWLYNEPIPSTQFTEQLIWLADSAFINGQEHRFQKNTANWICNEMPHPPFVQSLKKIDTMEFETEMERLQQQLSSLGFQKGSGQTRSRYKQLTGFQCQSTAISPDGMTQYIHDIFSMIGSMTGWQISQSQLDISNLRSVTGARTSESLSNILKQSSLDSFLSSKNVFSYAIPFRDNINYTVGIL